MPAHATSFGPFIFQAHAGLLLRDNQRVALGRRSLALLAALLEADGASVGKDELMDRAWPGMHVEEGNLTVQIATLRKALGNAPDGEPWILTIPRVGYRLPVARREGGRPSVAVLPLALLGGDAADRVFVSGIVSDLTNALARFKSLAVVAHATAAALGAAPSDLRQVARELGARYLLEGVARPAEGSLRINAQLIDGTSGLSLWCGQFDTGQDRSLAAQDRITERMTTQIEPAVLATEIERVQRQRPASIAAYDTHLKVLALLGDESEPSNAEAFGLLRRALAQDPDDAMLLAHAAWTLEHRIAMGWPGLTDNDREVCLDHARRGIALSRGDATVLAQCGMALVQTGREYATGLAVLREAARLNPHDLHAACSAGIAIAHCGDLDEAEAHLERALTLAPGDPHGRFAHTGLAMIAIIRGSYEQALAAAASSLALNDRFDATYWMLIAANAHLGRHEAARASLDRLRAIAPQVTVATIRDGQPLLHPDRIETVLVGLRLAGLPEA